MGGLAACAGRTLEPYSGDGDSGPNPTATTTGSTNPTGTTTTPPPPPPPPPNPKGEIKGTITGDPGCPKSLTDFQGICTTAGAVCDVNLTESCTGTKLRYMCVRYDQKGPGYWTEALHPSLDCSCPTTPPSDGSQCTPSLPRECTYTNPQCPNEPYARLSYSCNDFGNGKGYWQGYSGWCNDAPDGGWPPPPPPWDGGWDSVDGGWMPTFDAGSPGNPPSVDGGKPK